MGSLQVQTPGEQASQGDVAQLVRALPCHGRGRGFEPRRPRQISKDSGPIWHVTQRSIQKIHLFEIDWNRKIVKERLPATGAFLCLWRSAKTESRFGLLRDVRN